MTTIATLLERVSLYTQDTDHMAWTEAAKRTTLLDAIATLARQEHFGEIEWHQGRAGEPLVGLSPGTMSVAEVVYDARSLRRVDDQSLARHTRHWETIARTPQLYTTLLEAPETLRLVPAPTQTGSDVPRVPGLPVVMHEAANVLAWTFVNPQGDAEDIHLPEIYEDIAVFETVASLCEAATEYQDLAKAMTFRGLATLLMQTIAGTKET